MDCSSALRFEQPRRGHLDAFIATYLYIDWCRRAECYCNSHTTIATAHRNYLIRISYPMKIKRRETVHDLPLGDTMDSSWLYKEGAVT